MHKREPPKMTKDKFTSWKDQMKLHLSGIGVDAKHWLEHEHVTHIGPLTMDRKNGKRNHNSMMIDISSTLIHDEFYDVNNCTIKKKLLNK